MMVLDFLHLGLTLDPVRGVRRPPLGWGEVILRPLPQAGHSVIPQILEQLFYQLDLERLL